MSLDRADVITTPSYYRSGALSGMDCKAGRGAALQARSAAVRTLCFRHGPRVRHNLSASR